MPSSRRVVASKSRSVAKIVKGTLLLKVNPKKPEIEKIQIAARIIKKGGLVAFPTETVYGLGADALNPNAVKKIFTAKQRPPDNPMIVHVANKEDVYELACKVPATAEKLMSRLWPGPLTLILRRSKSVPDITVVGLDTIAIRMPKNEVALALIKESGTPIAAPSANLAGRPSPTEAEHVINDLAGRIDAILDAGPTRIGVESTVVDMTASPPLVLRPGGTSHEKLKSILGNIQLHQAVATKKRMRALKARSPGMKHRHYAPNAQMTIVEGEPDRVVERIQELAYLHMAEGKKVGILATDETRSRYRADIIKSLGSRKNVAAIAHNLFKTLREFDKEGVEIIIAEGMPQKGLGLAIMNRLRRAANFNVIETR